MSTLSASVRAAKSTPAEITIKGQRYGLEAIDPGEDGSSAFVVTKANGDSYAVIRTHAGLVECDCPDYEVRHRGLDCSCCKHGRALVEAGLLEAPRLVGTTAPEPTPAEAAAARAWDAAASSHYTRGLYPDYARMRDAGTLSDTSRDLFADMARAADAAFKAATDAAGSFSDALTEAVEDYEPTVEDLEEYGRWCDGERWELGPDAEPTLDLHGFIRAQADVYRMLNHGAGDLIASHLDELARLVRMVQARTPGQAADRIATMERDADRDLAEALAV